MMLQMKFYKSENTPECLDFCKRLIEQHGVFENLYVDRARVYGGIKRSGFSQFERALGELCTHVIYALSPQGKGRIERLFNTLQDRMIPEMRLNKIKIKKAANELLEDFTRDYNSRYSVRAQSSVEEFKKPNKELDEVFCIKETRQVGSDHTIS
jgi:hypothetical protein